MIYTIEYFKERGTKILDKLPNGWVYKEYTTTQPNGYRWACNNKSMFCNEYESALIKESEENQC